MQIKSLFFVIDRIRKRLFVDGQAIFGFLIAISVTLFSSNTLALSCENFFNPTQSPSKRSTHRILNRPINLKKMNTLGYDIINTKGIWNEHQLSEMYAWLRKNGDSSTNNDFSTAYDFRIWPEKDQLPELEYIPEHLRQPLELFLNKLLKQINRKFADSEGVLKLSKIVLRDYSRDDLAGRYHTHEDDSSYMTASIAVIGPGTVVVPNPNRYYERIKTKKNQLVLLTDGVRAKSKLVPATPHGSPVLQKGEKRMILIVIFERDN